MSVAKSPLRPTIANGFVEAGRNPLTRKIAIVFDDETFDEIKALAIEKHCSFASMVRALCELGLEDERQDK